jgi:ATP-dependent Clp protease ATP-binding subunit ClpA
MRVRFLTLAGLLLLSATSGAAQGRTPIPAGLRRAKPHEIVEGVLNMKAELALSPDQVSRLTAWHEQVADEPHRFKHDPTKKPHDVTHVPMIGRQEAFDSTVAILTPAQRNQLASLFGTIPPGLSGHKPHEIIEQVLNKKADLALSEDQVARLTAWHEQVADEPHRFKHDPTKKPHDVTHVPMIGRQEAFDTTVAILTPAQRQQLGSLFAKRP